jgi:hypothetical protein
MFRAVDPPVKRYGIRLLPELFEHLNPMRDTSLTCKFEHHLKRNSFK